MESIIIRNIEEKDIPSVAEIRVNGWQVAYRGIVDDRFLDSMDVNKEIEKRKKGYKQNGFIVAELNKEVVGFCRYIDNNKFTQDMSNIDCELLALYVKPNLKYNGIGTKMFKFVVDEFIRKNKTKMIVWCLKDNEPSKRFYTKMGGKIMGEKEIEIGDKKYCEIGFVYDI